MTEWRASYSLNPPSLQRAPIWASISNIPFDLVTDERLSFIAQPLGVVVDAKPFTSVNSATIKVVVDLTKSLPATVEVEREDGQIVTLTVTYPWLPPLCPICNEFGHKENLCPTVEKPTKSKKEASSSGLSVEEKAKAAQGRKKVATEKEIWKKVGVSKAKEASKGTRVDHPIPDSPVTLEKPQEKIVELESLPSGISLSVVVAKERRQEEVSAYNHSAVTISKEKEDTVSDMVSFENSEAISVVDKKGVKEVTHVSPARNVHIFDEVCNTIVSKNAFDILSNEEEDISEEAYQVIVIYNAYSHRSPETPYFSGSPRRSRKKRKWTSKNSPISGGDLPLISGGRHQN